MGSISYGLYKLSTEDKFRFLCRQEIGDISLYSIEGSFDKILKYIETEKEYYQEYVTDGKEIEDSYLDGRKKKLIKFLEIEVDYDSYGPALTVYGLRELDEAEKEAKAKQDEARLEKAKEEKRAQYEKLKKEFETS